MSDLREFRRRAEGLVDQFAEMLRPLVEAESPSRDKARLDRLADHLVAIWTAAGLQAERVLNPLGGDHLVIRWLPSDFPAETKPWLVVGHFDTVWPVGTSAKMPFVRDAEKLSGPGTYDMKASLALALEVVVLMTEMGLKPSRPVTFLWTSDEEIGSPTSRGLIEEHARQSFASLVLEAPLAGGALKTARKGVGAYRLEVTGRSAHAGVEPEKGRSAIVELAHQVLAIRDQARPEFGTTLNVGRIGGGTANNVVAESAWADVDVRVAVMDEAAGIDQRLKSLRPVTPDVSLSVTGGLNRLPMERTTGTAALFAEASRIAEAIGEKVTEGSTGGGSDGNFTSAVGCPTLDGLGLEGAGAHAPHEHVDLTSFPFRATLLAGLLMSRPEFGAIE